MYRSSLGEVLQKDRDNAVTEASRKRSEKRKRRREFNSKHVIDRDEYVDSALSAKILSNARELAREVELEEKRERGEDVDVENVNQKALKSSLSAVPQSSKKRSVESKNYESDEEEDDDDDFLSDEEEQEFRFTEEIDEDDEKIIALFKKPAASAPTTLADLILAKIKEKEDVISADEGLQRKLDPKVVTVYRGIARLLKTYKSGKLPKAFKLIPKLQNWEEMLYLTEPHEWTSNALFMATRIFSSNLNEKMAQRFYNLVLLPRIREEIQSTKKLNHHTYMALKKSSYKPGAFFKGIILPMCDAPDCSLREASIVSSRVIRKILILSRYLRTDDLIATRSVLSKISLPVLHSAAALLKIAEMDYSGVQSVFLRTLLDKRYALPYKVVDAVYLHFMSFMNEERRMPVLWHQCFLVFAQRYKTDLEVEQKQTLKHVLRKHVHRAITPEIRRELFQSLCRGNEKFVDEDLAGGAEQMDLF